MTSTCHAFKKDGKRCTNKIKSNGSCGIKSHILYMRKQQGLDVPNNKGYIHIVITKIDPGARNPQFIVNSINERLIKGPSELDGNGFIYMYKIKGDASNLYRKVGRTERLPERRMKEWPSGTLVKSWSCKQNRMAEYLIHKYLDYARIERLAMEIDSNGKKKYLSVWKTSGEFVADKGYVKYCDLLGNDESLQIDVAYKKAKKRDIEWFKEEEDTIIKIIQIVVNAINKN